MSRPRAAIGLILFLALCFGAAGLGAIATTPEIDGWYQSLNKPAWNPPAWVFGPVWTTLYALMAIAGWLIWKTDRGTARRLPLTLFAAQLVLNVAWSWIFFRLHQPGWAFVELVCLWFTILATTLAFRPLSKLAAALLLPYQAWVTFAGVLNFTLWQLNS